MKTPGTGLVALQQIVEGTSDRTGQAFFDVLVKTLAEILDVSGVWVTEYLAKEKRLRALSFYLNGSYVKEYEYDVKGTPCEPVIFGKDICHIPRNVVELFPDDPDLKPLNAISYMGLALLNSDGKVLGHLAILDDKPMEEIPESFALFRVFASRAAAELRRMYYERGIIESQTKLSRLINGTREAVIEVNNDLKITQVNKAAIETFRRLHQKLEGQALAELFENSSYNDLLKNIEQLNKYPGRHLQSIWIKHPLTCYKTKDESFPTLCSVSIYTFNDEIYYALYIRNLEDQIKSQEVVKRLATEASMLREKINETHFDTIIGNSPAMKKVLKLIEQVAKTQSTVLIQGETGTGKELVAQAIHQSSTRNKNALVTLNCAALPPELIESELFGHVKGAFTGATHPREGRFALADKGTLFLDEIGEMPLPLQAKLLRVIQTGQFNPVGSSETIQVDVRVMAATHRNLQQEVEKNHFREDLYYRLNVFPISIPPLRERDGDVILIAQAIIQKIARQMGKASITLDEANKKILQEYPWPGNVRELQNIIERSMILSAGNMPDLRSLLPMNSASARNDGDKPDLVLTEQDMRELERKNILLAIEKAAGRIYGKGGAAELLQLPPTTLASRMKKLNITSRYS